MLQFLSNCRKHKVQRTISLLGPLLAKTYDGLDPLLDMAGARDLLRQNGFMSLYLSEQEFQHAQPSNLARRAQGVDYTELDRADIKQLEPALKLPFERGLLFDSASHVIGCSSTSEQVLFAFGHQHIGLTLAGITGKLIAELANGEQPSHNITPFSPRRFL